MRGSIVKRSPTSWALVVNQGRDASGKRKQKWIAFQATKKHTQKCTARTCSDKCAAHAEAEAKLAEVLNKVDKGTYVDASKTTLAEYLRDWHAKAVVPNKRPETARVYSTMIEKHVATAPIGAMMMQKVRPTDLEAFYATLKLAPSSVSVVHAVIGRALKIAVRDRLLVSNPAASVEDRPRPSRDHSRTAREHCWTIEEMRSVLVAARETGTQVSAFFGVALDTGARRSELLGLTWSNVDLDAGKVTISQQLTSKVTEVPAFAPTKTGSTRDVTLGDETIARLRAHRKAQRELMMRNRDTYTDFNLVFAKEPEDLQTPTAKLGQPCRALVGRHYQRVLGAANVRAIKVHGMRHSVATALLSAGVAPQTVAQRLGHAQVSMTMEVYAHALPGLQRDAATKLSALLAVGS